MLVAIRGWVGHISNIAICGDFEKYSMKTGIRIVLSLPGMSNKHDRDEAASISASV